MPRVYNRSRSSLKSTSFVTRHQTSSSSIGAKPSVSNVSSVVFSDLPVVLNDYKFEPDKPARRPYVVKPRKTLKSLDPALSPPRSVRRSQEFRLKPHVMRSRGSAPCVLEPSDEKWPETHMRQCLSSKSHTRLKELKDEIKAYEEKGKMLKLRSELFQRCNVLLDETGNPAEDKAVQVEVDTEATVRKKWKSLRTYFIRQAKELEKLNDSKGSEADDVVSHKYCLWPLYEKLKFLTAQVQPFRTRSVKLMDDDYKILDEMNDNTLQGNSDATKTIETIIYHVPNGDASPLDGNDSDDCQLVSVESVKKIPESQNSTTAASTSAAPSSTIELSKVSELSQTLGLSQYLPPPLKKIASTVQSKPQLNQPKHKIRDNKTQPNHQTIQHKVIQLTQELPKLPGQQQVQQITKEQQETKELPKSQDQQVTKEKPIPQAQQITKEKPIPQAQQIAKKQPEQQVTQEPMIYLAKQQPVQLTTQGQQTQQRIVVEAYPQSLRPNLLQIFEKNPSLKTMLTATNPPPLCKIPPLKRARLTADEQNKDQLAVTPTTSSSLYAITNTNETNDRNDADYQFFKSLMPFMKELPIKNRLRIRNSIQLLILKELETLERDKKLPSFSNKELCSNEGPTIELDGPSGEDSNGHSSVNVKEEDVEIECTDDLNEIKTETV